MPEANAEKQTLLKVGVSAIVLASAVALALLAGKLANLSMTKTGVLSGVFAAGALAALRHYVFGNPKRKLSNYLLDKRLQLRYVLFVTILSGAIAGALGYMIFQQSRAASESLERDLQEMHNQSLEENVSDNLASEDQALVYKMIGAGLGLVIVLSLYLVVMTHKVAGPLFKVTMYYDRMAEGRLGPVTPLRRGDMLQEFFAEFSAMHESVRGRAKADVAQMKGALEKLATLQNKTDYRGETREKLTEALEAFEKYLAEREKKLA